MKLQHPLPGARATDGYAYREAIYRNGQLLVPAMNHRAQDYAAAAGTPIRAAHAGTVISNRWTWDAGWVIWIRTGNIETGYAHMIRQSPLAIDAKVKAGRTIGHVGSTGEYTTGPHLHFMLEINGTRVDPVPYIKTKTNTKKPTKPTPATDLEEEEMKNIGFYYKRAKDETTVYMLCNFGSGFCSEYITKAGNTYNNPIARAIGSGSFAPITEGHANVIKKSLQDVRQRN